MNCIYKRLCWDDVCVTRFLCPSLYRYHLCGGDGGRTRTLGLQLCSLRHLHTPSELDNMAPSLLPSLSFTHLFLLPSLPPQLLVSSPDLIWCIYRFQYNVCVILKAICAGVGFGSGTETTQLPTPFFHLLFLLTHTGGGLGG